MTDRPILFSAPMVRALLDGRKTQTRRIAKFIEPSGEQFHIHNAGGGWFGPEQRVAEIASDYAPFAIGDRLWVKETFFPRPGLPERIARPRYRADEDRPEWKGLWKPSIFMPRWASRMTLTVTDVRVERLNDCSEADAIAEGIWCDTIPDGLIPGGNTSFGFPGFSGFATAVSAYQCLWNQINGAGAWEANPWVVAVSFDVRKGNIDG